MKNISIFITDDHSLFRQGVEETFREDPDFNVIGEADSIETLLNSSELKHCNILILDITLGEDSGLDAIPELKEKNPELKIIILSMHNKPILIKRAVVLGASGYILKSSPPNQLKKAVQKVHSGSKYLDPELSDSIFTLLDDRITGTGADSLYNTLSKREQEIFRLLAEGITSSQIAKQLYISRKTVDNHRSNILSKLGFSSSAELIQLADNLGVI